MNILVCNYENSGENVLIIVPEESGLSLGAVTVTKALTHLGKHFDDIYYIKDDELQYYLFEPLFADETFVRNMNAAAEKCSPEAFAAQKERLGSIG